MNSHRATHPLMTSPSAHHSSSSLMRLKTQQFYESLNGIKLSQTHGTHGIAGHHPLYRSNSSLEIHSHQSHSPSNHSSKSMNHESQIHNSKKYLFGSAHSIPHSIASQSNSNSNNKSNTLPSNKLSTPKSIRNKITASLFRKFKGQAKSQEEDNQDDSVMHSSVYYCDINSMSFQLKPFNALMSSQRRNTITGASAAHNEAVIDDDNQLSDGHHQQTNELLFSCSNFVNEVGGEGEVNILLNKSSSNPSAHSIGSQHQFQLANGFSSFENSSSFWSSVHCLNQSPNELIELPKNSISLYASEFLNEPHENWLCHDDIYGPLCLSIKWTSNQLIHLIIRCAHLFNCNLILSQSDLSLNHIHHHQKQLHLKEVIHKIFNSNNSKQKIQFNKFKLANDQCKQLLCKFDDQHSLTTRKQYKVGILLCLPGQNTEEQMYLNCTPTKEFQEFLSMIGQRVRLKGWNKYKGGLDTQTDSTGTHSIYTEFEGAEIMFHVGVELPSSPSNPSQTLILRKRHIGNDIVTVVFMQSKQCDGFSPQWIRSQFQHIFIVIQNYDHNLYKVAVTRSSQVPPFGPTIKSCFFRKNSSFIRWLLAKIINGENSVIFKSAKFTEMMMRTKFEFLKDLVVKCSTNTTFDSLPNCQRKLNKQQNQNSNPAPICSGAKVWRVFIGLQMIECQLGLSRDSLIVIHNNKVLFLCSTRWLIGWNNNELNQLKVFVHRGETLLIHEPTDQSDVINDIISVIKQVAPQARQTRTIRLNRNPNLGFHINPSLIITDIEVSSVNRTSLTTNSLLVQVCSIDCQTIDYDTILDVLKTSPIVTVTVIECDPNTGQPPQGCFSLTCPSVVHHKPLIKLHSNHTNSHHRMNGHRSSSRSLQNDLIKLITTPIDPLIQSHDIQQPDDVIITIAQPAKVLNELNNEIESIEWPSLVQTATKSINELDKWIHANDNGNVNGNGNGNGNVNGNNVNSNVNNVKDQDNLELKVLQLESDLLKENIEKNELEEQIKRLKLENERLHRESESAAAQLRRFTEWYWDKMK